MFLLSNVLDHCLCRASSQLLRQTRFGPLVGANEVSETRRTDGIDFFPVASWLTNRVILPLSFVKRALWIGVKRAFTVVLTSLGFKISFSRPAHPESLERRGLPGSFVLEMGPSLTA
jgi:hypothetical protein